MSSLALIQPRPEYLERDRQESYENLYFHTCSEAGFLKCNIHHPIYLPAPRLKIQTAVTGWNKFLHSLRIFGLLKWDATHL